MEETRSELWAGIVIIIAGILIVAMVMMVGNYADFYLTPRKEVVVYLAKVHGVKVNDPVRYAGMDAGQVVGVEYDQEKQKVKLTLSILDNKVLRTDTVATVAVSMMGIASVEIAPGTGPALKAKPGEGPLQISGEPTSTLQDVADKAGNFLDRLTETFGEEQRKQFQEIITNIRDASSNAKEMIAKITEIVEENREDVRSIIKHGDKTMKTLDQITAENREDIATTIRNIKKASEQLDGLFKQLDTAVKDIQATIADAKRFMGKANLILDENSENVYETLRNVKDVTVNLQIMSQDLRLHPWKLLNKPSEMEIITSDMASMSDQAALLEKELDNDLEQLLRALERKQTAEAQKLITGLKETIDLMRANQMAIKEKLEESRQTQGKKK